MSSDTELKRDAFGSIHRCQRDGLTFIRRDLRMVRWWLRPLAVAAAGREARSLRLLAGVDGVPALIASERLLLDRSHIDGEPMQIAAPRDPAYFRRAHRLLRTLRARGVVHNDLAKEPNWLVRDDGTPAIVDFQIAGMGAPRARWFRLLAREDLRHLLKHKRTYCPDALTPVEKRLLARSSWLARGWRASGKRLYNWVTRRLLRWQDNEGRG
jgi:RIO-like serine/threonine protein kinase